jgi:hypothetical protein
MIAAAVTYKLSALEHQGRYAERERVSKVVCGTTEELVMQIATLEQWFSTALLLTPATRLSTPRSLEDKQYQTLFGVYHVASNW